LYGMFSYTYSNLRGNYTGLTSSDIADGGLGGRNSPNNSRSFDEPYFSWNSMGGSSSGALPTDRPNTFKMYGYYKLPKNFKGAETDLGLFQYFYQGSPNTSFMDVGYAGMSSPFFPVDVVDRGKWVNVTQDPTTGAVTVGPVGTYRNPWYIQSDFNFQETYKISESKSLSFSATFTNLFNQHVVVAVNESIDSLFQGGCNVSAGSALANGQLSGCNGGATWGTPGGYSVFDGYQFYSAAMRPYSLSAMLNSVNSSGSPMTINSQYGKPLYYQLPRTVRLGLKFTF